MLIDAAQDLIARPSIFSSIRSIMDNSSSDSSRTKVVQAPELATTRQSQNTGPHCSQCHLTFDEMQGQKPVASYDSRGTVTERTEGAMLERLFGGPNEKRCPCGVLRYWRHFSRLRTGDLRNGGGTARWSARNGLRRNSRRTHSFQQQGHSDVYQS